MDSKLIKHKAFPKPSLLKDYLLDDMSSCSSNGFKSFPRRQCCTSSVRFLIEIDLKRHKKFFIFNKSPSKSTISTFRRVIAAVKRAGESPEMIGLKKPILPRNLSKKILNKSIFWKKKSNRKEIQRWKSFDQLLKEDSGPLDVPNSSIITNDSSKFTASDGNSSTEININFTKVKRKEDDDDDDKAEVLKNGDVSAESTTGSTTKSFTEKQWSVSEEKEQFSPVSVLDCPFDDDEEVSFRFQLMEGSRKEKTARFGCVEPLNLSKRFALQPDSDNESTESSVPPSSSEEDDLEMKAMDLVHQVMDSYKADRLLLDFFREKIISRQCGEDYEDLIHEAESWINGSRFRDIFLRWNRQPYLKDMEESREWKSLNEEHGEMALELEAVVFDALFDELLVDISSTAIV